MSEEKTSEAARTWRPASEKDRCSKSGEQDGPPVE